MKRNLDNRSLLLASLAVACAAVPASANLLQNGSFEDALSAADWNIVGNAVRTDKSPYPFIASDGFWAINFNGGDNAPNGVLTQSFTTVIGQQYDLSFAFGKWAFGGGTAALQVEVISGGAVVLDQLVSDSTGSEGAEVWNSYQFAFTATDASTTLRFTDRSNATASFDAILDNVVVVPAPGAAALLAVGGLLAGRRRR
jgi:hypothetical protein